MHFTQLETRGLGLVLGMWGWGFLISPVIAGALAEPIKQYPNVGWLQEGVLGYFLTRNPFFLPNMVAALLCLIPIKFVKRFVTETLPAAKCRSPKYILEDMWVAVCGAETSTNNANTHEETRPILPPIPSCGRQDTYACIEHEDDVVFPSHVMTLLLEHDIEDAIRDSKMHFDE
jgi:MFS family permease